jgi:hypothetical protein
LRLLLCLVVAVDAAVGFGGMISVCEYIIYIKHS